MPTAQFESHYVCCFKLFSVDIRLVLMTDYSVAELFEAYLWRAFKRPNCPSMGHRRRVSSIGTLGFHFESDGQALLGRSNLGS